MEIDSGCVLCGGKKRFDISFWGRNTSLSKNDIVSHNATKLKDDDRARRYVCFQDFVHIVRTLFGDRSIISLIFFHFISCLRCRTNRFRGRSQHRRASDHQHPSILQYSYGQAPLCSLLCHCCATVFFSSLILTKYTHRVTQDQDTATTVSAD